jgi:quinoprotein glucose dehydrogenase
MLMMTKKNVGKRCLVIPLYISLLLIVSCTSNLINEKDRSWSVYKADNSSSSYSPLAQISTSNVTQLKRAWEFNFDDVPSDVPPRNSQSNPIIIDGVMYTLSSSRIVYAINSSNGNEIWSYDPFDGKGTRGVERGVTYWENGDDKRIFFAADNNLIALNAITGKPINNFGEQGNVDLRVGVRENPDSIAVTMTSPGIIYNNLIICGSRISELYGSPPGYIRAYNCITGELVWTFHTIPLPGEFGYETWPKDAYKYAGGANSWSGMSVDTSRGMVFMSLGSPTYDFYGADRLGKNLFGNCVLALDAATGKYIWHYQTVHHDLWDYDLPSPPNLISIKKDGKDIDAVAQLTKQGFIFILDRETGKPIFVVEEKKVPLSKLPGEQSWPTQPFPLKPRAYARQTISENDLSNYSVAGRDTILQKFRSIRYEGMFTPPDLKGTLVFPGTGSGTSWGGGAFDSSTQLLYFRSTNAPEIHTMIRNPKVLADITLVDYSLQQYNIYCAACHGKNKEGIGGNPSLINLDKKMSRGSTLDKIKKGGGKMQSYSGVLTENQLDAILTYVHSVGKNSKKIIKPQTVFDEQQHDLYLNTTAYVTWKDPSGNSAITPPWGMLHALDLSAGEYVWEVPLGNDEKRNLKGVTETGLEGNAGPIVTAGGLIFIAGTKDQLFRAFEKSTGKKLWETALPGIGNAIPCTYMLNGKQYVAISVGGSAQNPGGSIVAFSIN